MIVYFNKKGGMAVPDIGKRNRLKARFTQRSLYAGAVSSIVKYTLLAGLCFIILYPFIVKFTSVFMSISDIADQTVMFVPRHPTLFNLTTVIEETGYYRSLLNTSMLSLGTAVLQTIFCAVIGYGFAKFAFRGNKIVFALVIFTMIVPPGALSLPYYFTFREFDLAGVFSLLFHGPSFRTLDTFFPMAFISMVGLGFKNGLYIFMMRQFFTGLPQELSEAAEVDGAGVFRTFLRINLPQARSMLLTIFLFSFSWQWTDSYYSLMFFPNVDTLGKVVSVAGIVSVNGAPLQANSMLSSVMLNTAAFLVILPLMLMYMVAQKWFVQGVESSGIVG